jgi:hypothetical protein
MVANDPPHFCLAIQQSFTSPVELKSRRYKQNFIMEQNFNTLHSAPFQTSNFEKRKNILPDKATASIGDLDVVGG